MKLSVLKKNQTISELNLNELIVEGKNNQTILLIGRSKECHIVLDDKQISREHSKITYQNGQWSITRISTDTPLLINSEAVENGDISPGDSVSIGVFTINFEDSTQVEIPVVSSPAISHTPVPTLASELLNPDPTKDIENKVVFQSAPEGTDDFTHESNQEEITQVTDMRSFTENAPEEPSAEPSPAVEDSFNEFISETEAPTEVSISSDAAPIDEASAYSLENIPSDDSSGDSDSTKVFNTFAEVQLELFGEFAPYDKFNLEQGKTFIGRDPNKCKIILNDPEVSTVHAVIIKNNMTMTLEDLNSANGTMLNGERINKASIHHRDEFIIGSTSFKVRVNSEFLKEESGTLMPVDENQTVEIEEIVEIPAEAGEQVNALGEHTSNEPQEKSFIKRIWKDEEKRKKAIYVVVAIVAAWFLLDDEQPKQPVQVAKKIEKSSDEKSKDEKGKDDKKDGKKSARRNLSEEEKRALSERYQIGKKHFFEGRYRDALEELQKISAVDPNFNTGLQTLIASCKEGLSKLEEQEKKRKEEEAAAERRAKVKTLVSKATEFVKEHRADLAAEIFNEIAKIDPENIEISRLKREMDDWTKEQQRIALEIAQKKRDREDRVEKLKPGKNLFLQKEWFRAAGKLDEFLKVKDMDEDLTKEASGMLKIAREEISNAVMPLQGKAKSLMEGQDLKGAYEVYQQILKIEPSNGDALNSVGEIREILNNKARKIYREAIISESLSLFPDAKDKFQEVQQISPVDSDYYKKASDKLKDYLD